MKIIALPWVLRLWTGCSESNFGYAKPQEVCGSDYWPKEPAPSEAEEERWDLTERWHESLGGAWVVDIAAAAFFDTNGDGAVGVGDRMDIVVNAIGGDSALSLINGETGEVIAREDASYFAGLEIGDVDPVRPGPEIVIFDSNQISLMDADGVYLSSEMQLEI